MLPCFSISATDRAEGATIHGISVSVSNAECHRPAGSYYVSRQKSGNKSMTDKARLLPRGHKGKISVELCQVLHCQLNFDPEDVPSIALLFNVYIGLVKILLAQRVAFTSLPR